MFNLQEMHLKLTSLPFFANKTERLEITTAPSTHIHTHARAHAHTHTHTNTYTHW